MGGRRGSRSVRTHGTRLAFQVASVEAALYPRQGAASLTYLTERHIEAAFVRRAARPSA